MDLSGARLTMKGAEAVFPLGSLYISGDWDEYWQFHLQQEHKSNHLALYSSGIPLMKQVLKARCSTTPPRLTKRVDPNYIADDRQKFCYHCHIHS